MMVPCDACQAPREYGERCGYCVGGDAMPETQPEWNGEPVNVARGWATVDGERIRVVRVFYNGEHFDLDDTDERGWRKVTNGHGSPRYGHKSVTVDRHSLVPDSWAPIVAEWAHLNGMDPDDGA